MKPNIPFYCVNKEGFLQMNKKDTNDNNSSDSCHSINCLRVFSLIHKWLPQFCVLVGSLAFFSGATWGNPTGGQVTAGSATISNPAPDTTQITQSSDKAIINWQSFSIQAHEKTQFIQPSSNAVALNRINPTQGVSQIFGQLSANGKIILINQAGIFFGPGSHVDVGGIIASTSDISDQNFMAGNYSFNQPSPYHGTIVNQGSIIAKDYGLVALVGSNVSNEGYIQANLGKVILASGDKFTVDFSGEGLLGFTVDAASSESGVDQNDNVMLDGVKNSGVIKANGGKILLSAVNARGIVDKAINMSGVAQANSVYEQNGVIVLDGDTGKTVVSGQLSASGRNTNQTGGQIKILGNKVELTSTATIDASGSAGGGTILVGGNLHGAGPETNALNTSIALGALLNANAIDNGNGGTIVVWSDGHTQVYGKIYANGGMLGGNGGFVETSGAYLDIANIKIDTRASNGIAGTWLLDPTNIYIALNQANATAAGMSGIDTSANTNNSGTFAASGAVSDSLVTIANLVAALGSSNVIVTTTNSSGAGAGNITVVDPISWSSNNSLTLSAFNNINVKANISNTGSGAVNVVLQSDNTGTGTGTVIFTSSNVSLSGAGSVVSIFYNPTSFASPTASFYAGGTQPIAYMLINSLGTITDAPAQKTLGSLSNSTNLTTTSAACYITCIRTIINRSLVVITN